MLADTEDGGHLIDCRRVRHSDLLRENEDDEGGGRGANPRLRDVARPCGCVCASMGPAVSAAGVVCDGRRSPPEHSGGRPDDGPGAPYGRLRGVL